MGEEGEKEEKKALGDGVIFGGFGDVERNKCFIQKPEGLP